MAKTRASNQPITLCTAAQVKAFLGIDSETADTTIDSLILPVSQQLLNAICRQDLMPAQDFTDYFPTLPSCSKIYLKHYPVNAIEEVLIGGQEVLEWDDSKPFDNPSGYRFYQDLNPENNQFFELVGVASCDCCGWPITYCTCFSNAPQMVVTYNAGYGNVPPALQQACVEWIAFKRNLAQVQAGNPGIGSVQIGDYSESAGSGRLAIDYMGIQIPAGVMDVIEQYKRIVV